MSLLQIANYLNLPIDTVLSYNTWYNVLHVRLKGIGYRFVSKKALEDNVLVVCWAEHNHYNDSDFYTTYFNPSTLAIQTLETGSTRYASNGNPVYPNASKNWNNTTVELFKIACENQMGHIIERDNFLKSRLDKELTLDKGDILINRIPLNPRKLFALKPNANTTSKIKVQVGTNLTVLRVDYQFNRVMVTLDGNVGFWFNSPYCNADKPLGTLTREDYPVDPITTYRKYNRFDRWFLPA